MLGDQREILRGKVSRGPRRPVRRGEKGMEGWRRWQKVREGDAEEI